MRKPGPDGVAHEPDTLVMTATPIPRTLALTLYGDLEVSIIDELPPGRTPITTRRTSHERSDEVWAFLRKQVAAGRQAYIVYPIIEGANDDQAELDFAPAAEDDEAADEPAVGAAPTSLSLRRSTARAPAAPTSPLRPGTSPGEVAPQSSAAQHAAPDPIAARLVASVRNRGTQRQPRKSTHESPSSAPKATSGASKTTQKRRPSLFPRAARRSWRR